MTVMTRPSAACCELRRIFGCALLQADPVFAEVAVHLDASVVQKNQQPVPLYGDAGQLPAEVRAAPGTQTLLVSYTPEGFTTGADSIRTLSVIIKWKYLSCKAIPATASSTAVKILARVHPERP